MGIVSSEQGVEAEFRGFEPWQAGVFHAHEGLEKEQDNGSVLNWGFNNVDPVIT